MQKVLIKQASFIVTSIVILAMAGWLIFQQQSVFQLALGIVAVVAYTQVIFPPMFTVLFSNAALEKVKSPLTGAVFKIPNLEYQNSILVQMMDICKANPAPIKSIHSLVVGIQEVNSRVEKITGSSTGNYSALFLLETSELCHKAATLQTALESIESKLWYGMVNGDLYPTLTPHQKGMVEKTLRIGTALLALVEVIVKQQQKANATIASTATPIQGRLPQRVVQNMNRS